MASLPEHLQPGDLISAELFNDLLEELRALREAVDQLGGPAGRVQVPSFLGRDFVVVKDILDNGDGELALGEVFDMTGKKRDPYDGDIELRVVLFQEPVARMYVVPNTAVDVVVSSNEISDGYRPRIDELLKPDNRKVSTTFSVGEGMIISGANFVENPSPMTVSFNGKKVNYERGRNPKSELIVAVPNSFQGVPKTPDELTDVKIVVETPHGLASISCTVKGPPENPVPSVTGVKPDIVNLGDPVTVYGSGFSSVIGENQIKLEKKNGDNVTAEIIEASTGEIRFKVPNEISWANGIVDVDVLVTSKGKTSVANENSGFQIYGSTDD